MGFANVIHNDLVDDEGQPITDLPFTERICSRFSDQITWLESQIGDVPLGWHPIFRNAIRSLRAVACKNRDGIEFSEPVSMRGALLVAVYYSVTDKVASGILYKLTNRSECTCQHCGRTYAVRFRKCSEQTLCAKCHVRVSLNDEVRRWVGDTYNHLLLCSQPLIEFDALPPNIQFLIPRHQVKSLHLESTGSRINYVTPSEMHKLKHRLEAIKRYLDEATE